MEPIEIALRNSRDQLTCRFCTFASGREMSTMLIRAAKCRRLAGENSQVKAALSSSRPQRTRLPGDTNCSIPHSKLPTNRLNDAIAETRTTTTTTTTSTQHRKQEQRRSRLPRLNFLLTLVVFVLLWFTQQASTAPSKRRSVREETMSVAVARQLLSPPTVERHLGAATLSYPILFQSSDFFSAESSTFLASFKTKRSVDEAEEKKKTKKTKSKSKSKSKRRKGKKNKKKRKKNKGKKRRGKGKKRKNKGKKEDSAEKVNLTNPLNNNSRSPGFEYTSPRKQRFYSKHGSSFHIAMKKNKVYGEQSHKASKYTILEVRSVQNDGVLTIRGVESGRYLCVTKQGKVKAKRKYKKSMCRFQERILTNRQNTYESFSCKGCFLTVKGAGKLGRIKGKNPNLPASQFLPRSPTRATAQAAKRGPVITMDISGLMTSAGVGPTPVGLSAGVADPAKGPAPTLLGARLPGIRSKGRKRKSPPGHSRKQRRHRHDSKDLER